MKFTLKLITTAVALAVSGSAFAAAGDIVVDVYDPISGQSMVMDTGVAFLTAAPTSTTTIQVATQYAANWTTFTSLVSSEGESLSALSYAAIAQTGTASNGTVQLSYLTPATAGFSASAMTTNAQTLANAPGTTPLASFIEPATGAQSWGSTVSPFFNYGGGSGIGAINAAFLGTGMGLYDVTLARTGATFATSPIADVTFNGTSISIAAVSTAAVPEPGSFALMGAGLLAIGALVRRRTRG